MCLAHIHNGFNTHARKLNYKGNAIHFQGLLLNLTKPFPNVCIVFADALGKIGGCVLGTRSFFVFRKRLGAAKTAPNLPKEPHSGRLFAYLLFH
jgi:hypothetical protein